MHPVIGACRHIALSASAWMAHALETETKLVDYAFEHDINLTAGQVRHQLCRNQTRWHQMPLPHLHQMLLAAQMMQTSATELQLLSSVLTHSPKHGLHLSCQAILPVQATPVSQCSQALRTSKADKADVEAMQLRAAASAAGATSGNSKSGDNGAHHM